MTLYSSADCLQFWKDQFKRPETDDAFSDALIYRTLSRAQSQVVGDIAAVFPRLMMGAPHQWTSADGGLTYQSTILDSAGNPIYPFGHAEVFVRSGSGYDNNPLYGSTYDGEGDIVFEGNTFRIPQRWARSFSGTLWVRCVQIPDVISASSEPTLQPPFLRELIVLRALIIAANMGGQRDPAPYETLYKQAWSGVDGTSGFCAMLTTQYARMYDGANQGIGYWRRLVAQGGLVGSSSL